MRKIVRMLLLLRHGDQPAEVFEDACVRRPGDASVLLPCVERDRTGVDEEVRQRIVPGRDLVLLLRSDAGEAGTLHRSSAVLFQLEIEILVKTDGDMQGLMSMQAGLVLHGEAQCDVPVEMNAYGHEADWCLCPLFMYRRARLSIVP